MKKPHVNPKLHESAQNQNGAPFAETLTVTLHQPDGSDTGDSCVFLVYISTFLFLWHTPGAKPSVLYPITRGSQGRNSRQEAEPWSIGDSWLTPPGLFTLLSYTFENHLPRDRTTRSGQGPPTLIITQENAPEA